MIEQWKALVACALCFIMGVLVTIKYYWRRDARREMNRNPSK